MTYYCLNCTDRPAGEGSATFDRDTGRFDARFRRGQQVPDWSINLVQRLYPGPLPMAFLCQQMIVMRDNVSRALHRAFPEDVRLVPATLSGKQSNYCVVAPKREVDCIDYDESKVDYRDDGQVRVIFELVLTSRRLTEDKMFWIPGGDIIIEHEVYEWLADMNVDSLQYDLVEIT